MKNNILYLCIVIVLLGSSCKKNNPAPAPSQKAALLVKTWKVNKVTDAGQNRVIYQNPLPAGSSVSEDYSRYQFSFSSKTYSHVDKTGTSSSGSWELSADETKLILDKGVAGKETVLTIGELSGSSLKYGFTESSSKTGNRELSFELTPVVQ
jgi:hypothetical protein